MLLLTIGFIIRKFFDSSSFCMDTKSQRIRDREWDRERITQKKLSMWKINEWLYGWIVIRFLFLFSQIRLFAWKKQNLFVSRTEKNREFFPLCQRYFADWRNLKIDFSPFFLLLNFHSICCWSITIAVANVWTRIKRERIKNLNFFTIHNSAFSRFVV